MSPKTALPSKSQFRSQLRDKRRALSYKNQQQASENLANNVCRQAFFRNAQRLGFYWPNDGEIDPLFLAKIAQSAGKKAYLPIVNPFYKNHLLFGQWQQRQRLTTNDYGIPEPSLRRYTRGSLATLDVIFLPLVAFDAKGNRLGMGGGYYDRTLAKLNRARKPLLIGIAHYSQQVSSLPHDSWDIPLHAIITDRGVHHPVKHKLHA